MEVAVQEPVAVREIIEPYQGTSSNALRHQLRLEPASQLLVHGRQPGRCRDAMQRGVLSSEGRRDRPERPGPTAKHREQIDAVDPVEHDARTSVHRDPLVDARNGCSGRVRSCQRQRFPLDHPGLRRLASQPEHAAVAPREHFGLAPGPEPLQVARRHVVRS